MITRNPNIRLRKGKNGSSAGLAKINFGNELAEAVNELGRRIRCGQVEPQTTLPRTDVFLIKITGNAVCGETYYGKLVSQTNTPFPTSNSTYDDTDIGTPTGPDVLIINQSGRGETSHSLTAGTPITHMYLGLRAAFPDEDGLTCYLINGVDSQVFC